MQNVCEFFQIELDVIINEKNPNENVNPFVLFFFLITLWHFAMPPFIFTLYQIIVCWRLFFVIVISLLYSSSCILNELIHSFFNNFFLNLLSNQFIHFDFLIWLHRQYYDNVDSHKSWKVQMNSHETSLNVVVLLTEKDYALTQYSKPIA